MWHRRKSPNSIYRHGMSKLLLRFTRHLPIGMTLLLGCGETVETVGSDVCISEQRWIGDDEGSPEMRPGHACIDCHSREDGPGFAIAGTVYGGSEGGLHQTNDCFGDAEVMVRIAGADGRIVEMTTNAAGNFFTEGAIALPYTASIVAGGREKRMLAPQTSGDCNGCHAAAGQNGAPGRIVGE